MLNGSFRFTKKHGKADYIDERISQLEHKSQAAQHAFNKGYDDEVVLAAFFHDIGHLCELGNELSSMSGCGTKEHEKLGADFLLSRRFSQRIVNMVRMHVSAQRYLCTAAPGYYHQLSEASKHTLDFQGGFMSMEEVADFEDSDVFIESERMLLWDDAVKEENVPLIDLDWQKTKARAIILSK